MPETALLQLMVAALIGGGAYQPNDIAGALAKAKEIRTAVTGHS